uniref:AI-2E family transporter n=1 Tax=Romanomermis culicivorax TaxID=13658 RepID=A0A915HRU7_ROMCU
MKIVILAHRSEKLLPFRFAGKRNSVFILSFKMSTFYGLYTYFIHTLFSLNVVILPSILAAIFASIPFLAPYWLFLPGALELYLVRGETASAVLFLVFSFLPTMFIDAAFYEEVKGSHPYLTGLAIVGGIYWLGLEGALIGPMLLCCMIVTLKMYQSILPK